MQTNNIMHANDIIRKNRVYAPIILGIVLLLVSFVIYPQYSSFIDVSTTIATLKNTKSDTQIQVNTLKELQSLFAGSGSSALKTEVIKLNQPFNVSDIMEVIMVNKFTKTSTLTPSAINIGSITVDAGKKLPSGLSLGTVSLNLSADNPKQIIEFITYLTKESVRPFTIDNISLPLDTAILTQNSTALSLSISLGLYYYE